MAKGLDLIIKGNIITVVNQKPRADAIGVKNGKIVSVGLISEVTKGTGKATQVLDLKDKTVLPGFIDTHTHLIATGITRRGVDLSSVESISEIFIKIKQRAKITPPRKWILCWEFNHLTVTEKRFPDIKELDAISSEHPIMIQHYDTHFLMLNSLAFKQFGLTKDMEGVVKDTYGEPTGLIKDPISTGLWYRILGTTGNEERLESLIVASQDSLKVGITTVHTKENLHDAKLIMENQERLPIRIHLMPFFYPLREENIDEIINAGFSVVRTCVATYADGSIEGRTAALFEPYAGTPVTLGMLYYSDDELYRSVEKAHKAGLQVSIHAESERSIEQVLRAYEKVLEKYPRQDHRHRIEHFEVPTMKQINRVARLGVALAMQPMFITVCEGPDLDYYRALLGDERVKRTHPFRSILDEGIMVSGGSDTPVTRMNPLGGIHACVNHPTREQRIDVYEAIEMFTINGAKIGFEEDLKGSIEPGKLADFVVLSNDPYRVPREKIKDIKVEMTIVGGKIAYENKLNQHLTRRVE
jgi:predicted amidohydrolase YtcJ